LPNGLTSRKRFNGSSPGVTWASDAGNVSLRFGRFVTAEHWDSVMPFFACGANPVAYAVSEYGGN